MNMASLGSTLLFLALCTAVYNVVATGAAYRLDQENRQLALASAHNAARAVCALLTLAAGLLVALLVTNNFAVHYVWEYSSRSQPLPYKIAALWAGQSGSLLFWAWMLSIYIVAMGWAGRSGRAQALADTTLTATGMAVATFVNVFFIGLIVFFAHPFEIIEGAVPPDGQGLNPLLLNYWMQIHPPALYLGYVGCTVPFAFAMAALLHRNLDTVWIMLVRRWMLLTWIVLTIGIVLGGVWAYETLGWGGYWAWDPVENASLMPWLTATAFVHSIMLQARGGTLKNWNIVLVTLTFLLSVFGTFITRSGVISSVHAFADGGIGGYFLGFLGLMLVLSVGLIAWRKDELASDAPCESPWSREGAFLLNNWLLVAAAAAVLWGTVLPTISQELAGQKITVGPPYFNRVMAPLGLVWLALIGIGPLLSWRRTAAADVWRGVRVPLLCAVVVSPLLLVLSHWHTGAATAFVLAAFATCVLVGQFCRGALAHRATTGESIGLSLAHTILQNRHRYGGYLVHLGVVLMFVGLTGSTVFKIETETIQARPGETIQVGEYTLVYKRLVEPEKLDAGREREVAAEVEVTRAGRKVTRLYPTMDFYKAAGAGQDDSNGQPQIGRRPAIMSNPAHDLYLALTSFDDKKGTAEIKAYLNPLVMWIWISMGFFVGGTVLAMLPERRKVQEPVAVKATGTSATGASATAPKATLVAASDRLG